MLSVEQQRHFRKRLQRLYGDRAEALLSRLMYLPGRYGVGLGQAPAGEPWDHRTVVLITYADTLRRTGEPPLRTLRTFTAERLKATFSTLHILPFFPWSSDDGFSVVDFRAVEPAYGDWSDVERLAGEFDLMFDLVLNHCSRRSQWFRDFVTGIAPARWYFLPMDPRTDLSAVVRPRASPLLTRTVTRDGPAHVWTTFSADQVDLNWQNPDVLFEFLDILFLYLSKGCRIFRLDAVAFLWKRIGTDCLHLPETHEVVKLLRDVLELVAPQALLLTETNVPHAENLSYFGDDDEAHMVYNFSLPPLVLHALLRADASLLRDWAAALPQLSPAQAFFNFTASHDGIGVRPLQGLLPDAEVGWLCDQARARGGRVSVKANADGSASPYELNISYRDALAGTGDPETDMARFLTSQAIMIGFKGIPGVYIHSLLGTPNDQEGVQRSGQNRAINRRKWDVGDLDARLDNPSDPQARIFRRLNQWIQTRSRHPAFHPGAGMRVMHFGPGLFAFLRVSRTGAERILCLHNVTGVEQSLPWADCFPGVRPPARARDLLARQSVRPRAGKLRIKPFRSCWLEIGGV
jgi:sucrose phosphorylase